MMTGFFPAGGIWSGPGITSGGQFNPAFGGTHMVTYSVNGCSDDKQINVSNLTLQPVDTVCTNIDDYALTFSPLGGTWSGSSSLTDTYWGIFDAEDAGPGYYPLFYSINGCNDSTALLVNSIDAGSNITVCPDQGMITLDPGTPSGGYWTGDGIVDSILGTYDPVFNGTSNHTDSVWYVLGLCNDPIRIRVRQTDIGLDYFTFCPTDTAFELDWDNVQRQPWGGDWTGSGIVGTNLDWFDPTVAGPGIHTLYYTNNTCTDSMTMEVYDYAVIDTPSIYVCVNTQPFMMTASPSGGFWFGDNIVWTGLYSPWQAGTGLDTLVYWSPGLCVDTFVLDVQPLPNTNLQNISTLFCFVDTSILLQGTPTGGVFFGDGVVDSFFNPLLADTGSHTIYYTVGTGDCAVTDSISTTVLQPITASATFTDTTICNGEVITISALGSGGNGNFFTYTWSHGLGTGFEKDVAPTVTTTYTVTIDDGCSDPASTTVTVNVTPPLLLSLTFNDTLCSGENGWAMVEAVGTSDPFNFVWNTVPQQTGTIVYAEVGLNYTVNATNLNTGCSTDTTLELPGYNRIQANFSPIPDDGTCPTLALPEYEFIDLSAGGTEGHWSFGDGETQDYEFGMNGFHEYSDTGSYSVTLYIENDGGCNDSHGIEVCIDPEVLLWVPASFTPNGDGVNDLFQVSGVAITSFEMFIYNRWGQLVWETKDINEGWDGRFKFEPVQMGGYPYVINYKRYNSTASHQRKGVVVLIK